MWVHDSEELFHYGVLGMRWGVRRSKAQLARARGSSKKSLFFSKKKKNKNIKETKPESATKKTVKDMTDDELRKEIGRLELEKRYKDLSGPTEQKKIFNGKQFVKEVLETSGKNLATQVVNEMGAKAINKAFGYEAVYSNNKKK